MAQQDYEQNSSRSQQSYLCFMRRMTLSACVRADASAAQRTRQASQAALSRLSRIIWMAMSMTWCLALAYPASSRHACHAIARCLHNTKHSSEQLSWTSILWTQQEDLRCFWVRIAILSP